MKVLQTEWHGTDLLGKSVKQIDLDTDNPVYLSVLHLFMGIANTRDKGQARCGKSNGQVYI